MQSELHAFQSVKQEYNALMREHDQLVKAVNNANNRAAKSNNIGNHEKAKRDAATASNQLRLVRSRTDNLGVSMSRKAATFGPDLLSDMNQLLNIKTKELNAIGKEVNECQSALQILINQRRDGVAAGQTIWQAIKITSSHINKTDSAIANAQQSLSGLSEVDSTRLVKIWMDHMKSAKEEIIALLFNDKAQSGAGLSNQPLTRFQDDMYNAGTMQDYTEFNSVLTDIGDRFTNEEYDLL
jgi:hypothetical protein